MDIKAVLIVTSAIIFLSSVIVTSYKTGFVAYSIWSFMNQDQPRFKVDKKEIGNFARVLAGVFLLNIIFGFVVVQDSHETVTILVWSLVNTTVIGWSLSYWILLEEKTSNQK